MIEQLNKVVLVVKNPPTSAGGLNRCGFDLWGVGRGPGGGQGNPLQYSCLKNPMDRGTGQAMVHRVTKSHTQLKQLSTHTHGCLIVQCKSGGKLIIWESGMQGI